jgi:hypothetical protein
MGKFPVKTGQTGISQWMTDLIGENCCSISEKFLKRRTFWSRWIGADAPVAQLVPGCDSLHDFEFPRTLAPTMTVAEFSKRVVSGVAL